MAKAYFIGGTPRVGKSILTLRTIQEKPMMAASTDAFRFALRRIIEKEYQPDLFHLGKYTSDDPERRNYLRNHSQEIIDLQNRESLIVWKTVDDFVKSNLEDGLDVLIEGIAILPALLSQVSYEYSAVFLGNQSEEHFDTILKFARANKNDWMHALEDETIEAFSVFNNSFSRYVENQAKNHNLPYVEIGDVSFEADIESALNTLLRR